MAARGRWLLVAVVASLSATPGCKDGDRPRPVSAELLDETPDGAARAGETIRIVLDRPLPAGWSAAGVKVRAEPPVEWTPTARRGADGRTIEVVIAAGSPQFRLEGVHGKDPGATGLAIDLGDGREVWLDLRGARSLPVLKDAVWEDASPPGGNMVVDRGDRIRLIFDRPVDLRPADPEGKRVRTPQDIILSKASDRLDDGQTHARFEKGAEEREVWIVLGSRPTLTIAGNLGTGGMIERFRYAAPSGLAVNGTEVLPMPKITARGGGPGAVSDREVDLRHADDFPEPRAAGRSFPPRKPVLPLVTPIAAVEPYHWGESADGRQALDQIPVPTLHAPGDGRFGRRKLPTRATRTMATLLSRRDAGQRTTSSPSRGSDGPGPGRADHPPPPAGGGTWWSRSRKGSGSHGASTPRRSGDARDPRREGAWRGTPPGLVGCAVCRSDSIRGRPGRGHSVFRTIARSGHTPPSFHWWAAARAKSRVRGFGRDRRRFVDPLPFGQRMDGRPGDDVFF
jgi:hypothetical protein